MHIDPVSFLGFLFLAGLLGTFIVGIRAAARALRWQFAVWRRNRKFRPAPPSWETRPIRAGSRPEFTPINKPIRGSYRPYKGYSRGATRQLVTKRNIR